MRNFTRASGLATALLVAFFGIAISSASANVFPGPGDPNDPAHAEQFSFYCGPYKRSFESGKSYLPTTSTCTYSIPATLSDTKLVALYKGVAGVNAVFVGGDLVGLANTLVDQSPNNYGGSPQNGDSFFAVVYEAALDQTAEPLSDYLSGATSTLPAGVVEGQNLYTIPWKWGPKPASEFDPVIVVPGILGSWTTDSGALLDPVFNTYDNLIDTLEANGYVAGQTLFTLPYDWEDSYTTLSNALASTVQSVTNGCSGCAVDIIAHGAASLAVTHYLENVGNQNDIDQVIFIGPPFNGIPVAYAAWEAGLVQFDEPVRNGVAQALLTHRAAVGGFSSVFNYIHNSPVLSFNEILPVTSYLSGKSYPTGYPQNSFLEDIHNNISVIFNLTNTRIHQLDSDSTGSLTPNTFTIVSSTNPPLWPHGEVTATQHTTGDGIVPFVSAEFFTSSDVFLSDISHQDLPTAAQSTIFETLNSATPATLVTNSYPTSCVLFLTVSPGSDLQITDPNTLRLGKDFDGGSNFAEISRSVYSGPNAAAEYLAVANPIEGTYQVRTQGNVNGSFTLIASDVCDDTTHSTSTVGTVAPGQILGFSVTVAEDDTLSIESLDSGAPVVTINTPAQGAVYLTTDSILTSVTVTDPESSPIAQTTYRLNGTLINHLNPLPLSSQPLGSAEFVVAATDVFGNTGYATSTFTIEEPAEAETVLTSNADTYLRGVASDTNEGASPILRIQGAGDNRVVVKFDQQTLANTIGNGELVSATLELEIEGTRPNWGTNGREVVVNRLLMNWTEGNGKNAELPLLQRFRGTGAGATWNCATDTDIKNTKKDCVSADDWNMRLLQVLQNLSLPWVEQATDGFFVQKGQQGVITFDVTADVQAYLDGTANYGWIVRKSLQNRPGYITFHSKESGAATAPRLILNYIPGN